jgi:hypothetical protein
VEAYALYSDVRKEFFPFKKSRIPKIWTREHDALNCMNDPYSFYDTMTNNYIYKKPLQLRIVKVKIEIIE